MSSGVLVLSARFGGPAEAVLRAIAHDNQDGIGEIADAKLMSRSRPAWAVQSNNQSTMASCLIDFAPASGGEHQVKKLLSLQLILGVELGVVLRDVPNEKLSRGRNFSTAHLIGAESEDIHYVMPIAPRILDHEFPGDAQKAFDQVHLSFCYAVYSICSFLCKHGSPDLLAHRVAIAEVEKARLFRKASYALKHKKADAREAMLAGDGRDRLWPECGWVG